MSQAGVLTATEFPFPPGDIPIDFVTDSGIATAIANVIQIKGGAGTTVTAPGSSNLILVTATAAAFTWNVVTSADNPVTLVPENGYICKGVSPVNFVLPASAAIGDTYKIIGYANLWTIAQNAFQTITVGIGTTTAGIFGGLAATTVSDGIELVCVTANLEWFETYIQGNITLT